MKTITSDYKDTIKEFGREIDAKLSYTIGGVAKELGADNLNSVSLHYEGGLLKSVMKQLDIDSNTDIPLGTQITAQFGVKVSGAYEYITLGTFIVYSSEKQADLESYKIICYDKLLYAMKDYEDMTDIMSYPVTINDFIGSICTKIGLIFANAGETFPNYDKEIESELFLDANGYTLGYTYRDVLDQLAQVTASTICINNSGELELRYINDTNDTIDEEFLKDINVNFGEKFGPVNTIVFSRSAGADNIHYPEPLPLNPIELKISDNQILNSDNRDTFIQDIYNQLNGLEYYINDFSSTGITYYELCDKYTVSINGTNYTCIMFNDEINITQGLEENIHTELPEESQTDYTKSTKSDRARTKAEIIVDKVNGQVDMLVSQNLDDRLDKAEVTLESQGLRLDVVSTNIDPITGDVTALKRTNYELGANGLIIDDEKGYKSVRNTTGDYFYENEVMTGKYTKDGSVQKDFALYGKYYYGIREDDPNFDVETFTREDAMFVGQNYENEDNEEGFGHFYNR